MFACCFGKGQKKKGKKTGPLRGNLTARRGPAPGNALSTHTRRNNVNEVNRNRTQTPIIIFPNGGVGMNTNIGSNTVANGNRNNDARAVAQSGFNSQDLRNGNNPMFHNRANGGDTRLPTAPIDVRVVERFDNRDLALVTTAAGMYRTDTEASKGYRRAKSAVPEAFDSRFGSTFGDQPRVIDEDDDETDASSSDADSDSDASSSSSGSSSDSDSDSDSDDESSTEGTDSARSSLATVHINDGGNQGVSGNEINRGVEDDEVITNIGQNEDSNNEEDLLELSSILTGTLSASSRAKTFDPDTEGGETGTDFELISNYDFGASPRNTIIPADAQRETILSSAPPPKPGALAKATSV